MPTHDSRGGVRRALATAGWFALGLACLATASFAADLALATLAGLVESTRASIWQTRPAVAVGAFSAAVVAISLARLHPRLGAETLRATWAVAVLDIGLSVVAAMRGEPFAGVGAFEGIGFLAAAALMSWLGRRSTTVPGVVGTPADPEAATPVDSEAR